VERGQKLKGRSPLGEKGGFLKGLHLEERRWKEVREIDDWAVDGIGGLGRERLDEGVYGILVESGIFVGRCQGPVLMPLALKVLVLCLNSRKMGFGRKELPLVVGSSGLDGQYNL
jgi:hypothetical protein